MKRAAWFLAVHLLLASGLLLAAAGWWCPAPVRAHTVYLANDNHIDYGWDATTEVYDAAMLSELDYYLGQIDATAANPSPEQARFNTDGWFYLYLYEQNRSRAQFQRLIDAMHSGHITIPLNPFVTLYGALPTEAAIRAGYYPGRIERQYGVSFLIAEEMENATIPWGLASLWAGGGVRYSWKGICGCATTAPYDDRTEEVFRWQGPDDREVLMKWYHLTGKPTSWGGVSEARDNLSQSAIQRTISHFESQPQSLPLTGLFGAGWTDVTYKTSSFVTLAQAWNEAHPGGDQVVVSNQVDYFEELEDHRASLAVLRGGWGNDWDGWPAALSERTASTRRAIERLRTAEALAAIVHDLEPGFWPPQQATIEAGLIDYFKYFEHSWGDGGVGLYYVVNNKRKWARNVDDAVEQTETSAAAALVGSFDTPNEDRFIVFNPLAFDRTDFADLPVIDSEPFTVTDVETGEEVPSQVVVLDDIPHLRVLARNVPSLGYRTYRYATGEPSPLPDAAVVSGSTIESELYRVTLGSRGEIVSAVDKTADRELADTGLNDFGSGTAAAPVPENVGPVSATVRVEISGNPRRRVRLTLVRDVDRIIVEDEILSTRTITSRYRYDVNLAEPQIRFEEVGAIARPGLVSEGGDFLQGTRADLMTLNHFVNFANDEYNITLSNWDAFVMRVGNSTTTAFTLPTSEVGVLATGNPSSSEIRDQGGDIYFLNRFALRGASGSFSASQAMAMSLAHQNPLRALALPRNQRGPLSVPTAGFLSISEPNVIVTAFKPAEEGDRGWVMRLWELDGRSTSVDIDASAFAPTAAFEVSLIETDWATVPLDGGVITATLGPNEMRAYRFTTEAIRPGDVNNDGQTTAEDLPALISALFDPHPPPSADVNRDGRVTSPDVTELIVILQTPLT